MNILTPLLIRFNGFDSLRGGDCNLRQIKEYLRIVSILDAIPIGNNRGDGAKRVKYGRIVLMAGDLGSGQTLLQAEEIIKTLSMKPSYHSEI